MRAKNVDGYITGAPEKYQGKLRQLRKIIRETVPEAEEKISYSMPYYGYYGRLAYFALAKHHIGLYIPPPIIEEHKKDLKGYGTTVSAVHLPLDQDLPVALIQKLVKAKARQNEASKKKK